MTWWRSLTGLARLYLIVGSGATTLYLGAETLGWQVTAPAPRFVPAANRQSPGGYRSFHFWHSGYEGGK